MVYRYQATEKFWQAFYELSPDQKELVRTAWKKFKLDPFEGSLGTHKIASLSRHYNKPIYSVVIDNDLRVLFAMQNSTVTSLIVGTHSVYKT